MLGENIKTLRKQKGYSQDTLAAQLNVVRQTISKWEKGHSVPDAEMLERIATVFEVSVSKLLGNNIPESDNSSDINGIVKQLAILNEQLANQNRNRKLILKIVLISIASLILICVMSFALLLPLYGIKSSSAITASVELYCTLDGEEYSYEITYDEQNRVITTAGDEWINEHIQTEQYTDANILISQIEDYFTEHGGTCEIIDDME